MPRGTTFEREPVLKRWPTKQELRFSFERVAERMKRQREENLNGDGDRLSAHPSLRLIINS